MVGGLAQEEDGGHQHVGLGRDELGPFDAADDVRARGKVESVLLHGSHGDDDHVGSGKKILDLGHGHMRQVVLHLLLAPDRAGLGCSGCLEA